MALRTRIFYVVLFCLVILDSFLLSKPNLLGKIGLLIYKYHYLRSFPRTLLTVSCVIGVTLIIGWIVEFLVQRKPSFKKTGVIILSIMLILSILVLAKTAYDFTAWSYSHTGKRFRYGAYLLPMLMIFVFGYFMLDIQLSVKSKVSEPDQEIKPVNDGNDQS